MKMPCTAEQDEEEGHMYTFRSQVRYSELDADGKLSIASIVDYFQDCSTFQSEELGVGIEYLNRAGMLWVMSYWQIVIDRYPKLCERITIGTFPYEFKGFLGYRNFFIADEAGEKIVRANSIWTLMDMKAGRPARHTKEMVDAYRLEEKLDMNYEPRKIRFDREGEKHPVIFVGKQHLDSNHHVNNGQYIHMAQDYLPEGFEIGQMRAEYKKSALLNDCIVPEAFVEEDRVGVSLCSEEGEPYAIVEFRRKARGWACG